VDGLESISAASVTPVAVEWLWPGRVPLGGITLLAGDPGLGKSLLTFELAAQLSRGELAAGPATTLMATAEDSRTATVVPRLQAAAANLALVEFLQMRKHGLSDGMTLPDDAELLASLVRAKQARMVVIDPLMAHLPSRVNSWQDQSVRSALAPLHRLAEQERCAVVLVVHLNKGQDVDPLRRIGGSVGLPAAARSVLLLARDPDDPDGEHGHRRVLAHVKSNLAGPSPSLQYQIDPTELPGGIRTARIRLLGESHHQGHDLLSPPVSKPESPIGEAEEFLRCMLGWGPQGATAVQQAATQRRISPRTLKRAKGNLGVQSQKAGYDDGWIWSLPEDTEA
jgi:RecA/RadA recombinase